jgi:uncharacterized RDD family membrane protein YckC
MVGFIDAYKDFMMQAQQYAQDKEAMSEYAKEFFKPYMQDFYFMYFLVLVYFSLEFIVGASLGKLILGIRIAGNDMKPASFGNLIYRYLLKHSFSLIALIGMITGIEVLGTVGMLVGLVVFIGLFFVLSHNRLSFHDMLAKTAVYNKNFIDIEESTEN